MGQIISLIIHWMQTRPTATSAPPRSSLLGISPELRNKIYNYVLEEDSPVEVIAHWFNEPGLLRTNKQLRAEASPHYWANTTIYYVIQDYDSDVVKFWDRKAHAVDGEFGIWPSCAVYQSHFPNWDNLERSLKRWHVREIAGLFLTSGNRSFEDRVIQGMAELVCRLENFDWEEVRPLVSIQRDTLCMEDRRWGKNQLQLWQPLFRWAPWFSSAPTLVLSARDLYDPTLAAWLPWRWTDAVV